MLTRDQLIKRPEYWVERIQNDIYNELESYMRKNDLNQTELASRLGFSKGYISQVLNGNFNFSLKKLVELSLAIGVSPHVRFDDIDDFIQSEKRRQDVRDKH